MLLHVQISISLDEGHNLPLLPIWLLWFSCGNIKWCISTCTNNFLAFVFFFGCWTPFINDLDLCIKFQALNCHLTISMDAYIHTCTISMDVNFYGCRLTHPSIYVDSILNYAWKHFRIHAKGKYARLWLYTFNLKLYMH